MATSIALSGYINDAPYNYDKLFRISQKVRSSTGDIEFQFRGCNFLSQNAIAFIGGLTYLVALRGNSINYNLEGINPKVQSHIEDNGFLDAFISGNNTSYIKNTAVPFRVDMQTDTNAFTNYLRAKWLNSQHIGLDEELKDIIITNVMEAYVNVFDHANSPIGIATCGQFFPSRNNGEIVITMVDFGVGIPYNVRQFLNEPEKTSEASLKWALQPRATTKRNDASNISRGLGLKELKRFVQLNNGSLEIYSDSGYVKIDRAGENFSQRFVSFAGTVVQIALKCDSHYYRLEELAEDDDEPLF